MINVKTGFIVHALIAAKSLSQLLLLCSTPSSILEY